jgi:hypothetical protein
MMLMYWGGVDSEKYAGASGGRGGNSLSTANSSGGIVSKTGGVDMPTSWTAEPRRDSVSGFPHCRRKFMR